MTRKTILQKEEYKEYFDFILKHPKKCWECEREEKTYSGHLNNHFEKKYEIQPNDMRNRMLRLEKLNFISYKDQYYSINALGLFNFLINNFLPITHQNQFLKEFDKKSSSNKKKFLNSFTKILFNNFNFYKTLNESFIDLQNNLILNGLINFLNGK